MSDNFYMISIRFFLSKHFGFFYQPQNTIPKPTEHPDSGLTHIPRLLELDINRAMYRENLISYVAIFIFVIYLKQRWIQNFGN